MAENEPKTAEQKKRDLYLRQKELLATLLEHGAISQAQHDKSLRDLTAKMGMPLCFYLTEKALPAIVYLQGGSV